MAYRKTRRRCLLLRLDRCDFKPQDWRKRVETERPNAHHDVPHAEASRGGGLSCAECKRPLRRSRFSRQARALGTLVPNFIEFIEKCVVIFDFPKLIVVPFVFLQRPIRRRYNNEVNACIRNPAQIARIAEAQTMFGSVKRRWPRMRSVIFIKR